jgi:ABC-type sugar transport system ATPase subunit
MTVSVVGLKKSFGGAVALAGVDLTIGAGEIHALLGPNGAGKSTLIRCLGGAISPDAGRICIEDDCYDSLSPAEAIRAGVAVIYQNLSLVSSLSVAENIFLGCELRRGPFVDHAEQRRRAANILATLGAEEAISPSTRISALPVALQQLVEIARALNRADVKLLILDEPTAALSEAEAAALADRLRLIRERGVHILYITHLLHEVLSVADEVTVIRDGRVAFTSAVKETSYEQLVTAIAPMATGAASGRATVDGAEIAIESTQLSGDRFGPISLAVRKGEIVALFGLVGSGRTEFLETLFGVRRPTGGKIEVTGRPARFRGPADAIRNGLALVPAERVRQGTLATLTVLDNLLLPARDRLSRRGFRDTAGERTEFRSFVEKFRLVPPRPDAKLQELSGGNQQKVVVGRWLEAMPRTLIVLLDEPTMGIDIGTRREVYEILRRTAHGDGRAVLFASSDPEEVVAVADRAVVLARGNVVGELTGDDLTEDSLLALAHSGAAQRADGRMMRRDRAQGTASRVDGA